MLVGKGKDILKESEFYFNMELVECEVADSVKTIEKWAFGYCINMVTIFIPASVVCIEEQVFDGCRRLARIEVDSANTRYRSINGILYDATCTKLIKCPCAYKQPIFNILPSVMNIGNDAFKHCAFIRQIIIGENVKTIGSKAFAYCEQLEYIYLSKEVRSIGMWAFSDCYNLKQFEVSKDSLEYGVFEKCLVRKTQGFDIMQFPLGDPASFYYIDKCIQGISDRAFTGASCLKHLDVDAKNNYYKAVDGVLIEKKTRRLVCFPTMKNDCPVYEIPEDIMIVGNSSLKQNNDLRKIVFPKNLKLIERHALEFCHELREVTLSGCKLEKIEWCAFMGCTNLLAMDLGKQNSITIDSLTFNECTNLEDVILPAKENCHIAHGAFRKCDRVKIRHIED